MSTTTVYAAFDDGDMTPVASFRNAFRGAFHVWAELSERYLGHVLRLGGNLQTLWDLDKDPRLTDDERLVHVSTFDRAFVRREHMRRIADALDAFVPSTENLTGQAAAIRKAWEDGARVVAWCHTSVAGDLDWSTMGPRDEADEDAEAVPFNIDRDKFTGPEVVPR